MMCPLPTLHDRPIRLPSTDTPHCRRSNGFYLARYVAIIPHKHQRDKLSHCHRLPIHAFCPSPRSVRQICSIVATAFFKVFCDVGFPRIICSDNGSEFVNQLMELMLKHCGIDHRWSTKYHLRGNGLAEHFVGIASRAIKNS